MWNRSLPCIATCRLPASALQDGAFRDSIREHIVTYFETNMGSTTDTEIEWDVFEVVLRGHAMKSTYSDRLRRELQELESELRKYEKLLPIDESAAAPLAKASIGI
ncbi:hypothetical protein NDU88_004039 [Pleurodeles waltl]|uniref:Uncharacterized protein n=1 Tax=Pleurodeles waltl TaxID=8319 RepID=A0AAV7NME9_PLEWA|nr:hypothetical protein NDU88_004039 [Pleurodeles waltl]